MNHLFLAKHSDMPRKEGRSHPYHPSSRQRQRALTIRLITIVLGILAVCTIVAFWVLPSSQGVQNRQTAASLPKPSLAPPPAPVVEKPAPHIAIPEEEDTPSHAPFTPPPEKPKSSSGDSQYETPHKSSHGQSSMKYSGFGGDTAHLERALERVIDMLPDEMHVRELLRPFEGTGKEKLRDVGLRTRAYKKFFEAWENLHLVMDGDTTYVRDDVLQYVRDRYKDQSSELSSERTLAQTMRAYEAYRSFLQRLATLLFPWTAPYFADHMSLHSHFHRGGRGIVLTAGDEQAPFLLTSIPSFRKLGCDLPIEIMYLGDNDMSEDYRAELEMLPGVVTRDLSQMVNDDGWRLAGWAGKPFAMLFSSFREVIFVDADALFFRNPEVLFDDPAYQKTGALFFKDRLIMPEQKKRWLQQVIPKPISKQVRTSRMWSGESGHQQESGVVVVDKWKHFIAMLLVTRMNGPDRDGNKDEGIVGIYDMVYGDKETFWIGWELVGDTEYLFHEGDAGIMGQVQKMGYKRRKNNRKRRDAEDSEDEDRSDDDHHDDDHRRDDEHGEEADEFPAGFNPEDPPANGLVHPTSIDSDGVAHFTICAPQLLHLDLEGRPLWFNGWLLHNKFADRKEKQGNHFELYMKEPRQLRDPGAWQLEENNICCLTNEEVFPFTPKEKETLDMIISIAKEVGAYGGK